MLNWTLVREHMTRAVLENVAFFLVTAGQREGVCRGMRGLALLRHKLHAAQLPAYLLRGVPQAQLEVAAQAWQGELPGIQDTCLLPVC
jgi:hypothetical protein